MCVSDTVGVSMDNMSVCMCSTYLVPSLCVIRVTTDYVAVQPLWGGFNYMLLPTSTEIRGLGGGLF